MKQQLLSNRNDVKPSTSRCCFRVLTFKTT